MMTLKMRKLALLALGAALCSCAPGLGRSLGVSPITLSNTESPSSNSTTAVQLQLRPFVDNRPSQAIAIIDGRDVNSKGDLGDQVKQAFETSLKDRGIDTANPNAPIVSGQISSWFVRIDPSFPVSSAFAEATLVIEVSNLSNQVVFTGKYSGDTVLKHPMLTESRISDALAQAMAYAIDEALRDDRLMSQIQSTAQTTDEARSWR
ncbi:MAG: hypothetical protein J0M12_13250 [Deltaproteobacteria bacterium]|nr:hypothetical protein [Deltaproteobacteria bacterium]